MRKTYFKGDRTFNLDWIDDEWLWLFVSEPIPDEILEWTEQDIMLICECLLKDSLQNLFDGRCAAQTVVEIYKWMTNVKDPNPFSFVNCCLLTGLDPEQMRDSILNRLERSERSRRLLH